jgi:hypothetical protein
MPPVPEISLPPAGDQITSGLRNCSASLVPWLDNEPHDRPAKMHNTIWLNDLLTCAKDIEAAWKKTFSNHLIVNGKQSLITNSK